MQIWVDADAAPRDVKEVVFRVSKRLKVQVCLVANSLVDVPAAHGALVRAVRVSQGANVADRYIEQHASADDIVVTADIPLAAALVEKGVAVIDPRGELYDKNNIRSRLAARDFFESVRAAGQQTPGAAPYAARDKKAFADTLDRTLARLSREPNAG
ncbi:MAG: YaiI/YqxD family protein [Planctomycetota bacterium]